MAAHPQAHPSPVREAGSRPNATAPEGVRILIVDDNPRVRRSTAKLLSRIGFHVVTADDADPAVALVESTPPDLALIDFEMPTSGLVLVRKLKELCGPAVWVAVLSGNDSPEVPTACFDAGADDVIIKPVPVHELQRRVVAAARTQQAFVDVRVARERADRLMAYGGEAVAMLAHDLNNGLAVALCNMDYLEETALGLDAEQTLAVASTRNALRRMSGLVANFVDIARFEDAAVKPHCTEVNISNLLEAVVSVHSVGGKAQLLIDCEPDHTGYLDAALIERVLHNLVGNAVRYCNGGEILISSHRYDDTDSQAVEITVFNSGPRIAPELENNLFGKYAKGTDGKRGFGLYFCRLACEAHNGRIMYRGSDDGAAFVIRLPGRG